MARPTDGVVQQRGAPSSRERRALPDVRATDKRYPWQLSGPGRDALECRQLSARRSVPSDAAVQHEGRCGREPGRPPTSAGWIHEGSRSANAQPVMSCLL